MTDELAKVLLLEEATSREVIAELLLATVMGPSPFVQVLAKSREVSADVLGRYLARTEAPFLRQVVPLLEIVEKLPPGLCAALLALPVRRDAITGTVDVVVVDAADPHPGQEIAFHLGAPVRLVRAPLAAIEDALRRLRSPSLPAPAAGARDDERLYDSRPRAGAPPAAASSETTVSPFKGGTLPPADPGLRITASQAMLDALSADALRPSRVPVSERQAHVMPSSSSSFKQRRPTVTPPWGTQVGAPTLAKSEPPSDPPRSGLGSEIPIPLTRRTYAAVSGGTQRPPPLIDPRDSLGEGYAVDAGHFRQIVEVNERSRSVPDPSGASLMQRVSPIPSFIPGPPPLPDTGAYDAQTAFADIGGILAALRAAGARDEVLELVMTGARMVARKVALFVVKRGGYLGWACTPEFGERAALQSILVPLESTSVFEDAVRDGLYLGPLRHDEGHAALLHVMHGASRDVAVVPVRVSGKTAVVVLADELGDTMLATRRLEELARAAGEAFARIVRMRR